MLIHPLILFCEGDGRTDERDPRQAERGESGEQRLCPSAALQLDPSHRQISSKLLNSHKHMNTQF